LQQSAASTLSLHLLAWHQLREPMTAKRKP
jgi:hypothetical protein